VEDLKTRMPYHQPRVRESNVYRNSFPHLSACGSLSRKVEAVPIANGHAGDVAVQEPIYTGNGITEVR